MHSIPTDFETMCSFENLYQAYKKARSGKRDKSVCAKFELHTTENLLKLRDELLSGTYRMEPYTEFMVYEPKERLVKASSFRDRIVQHTLCDNVLQYRVVNHFIYDNYASQKGKGTHFGLNRLWKFMRSYYRNCGTEGWILKADISKFFYSIDHDILKEQLKRYILDKRVLKLCFDIIDSTIGVGIPIGNQTSQVFALMYLNDLDHLIKDQMGIKYYGRYMDDFYIILQDKNELKEIKKVIEAEIIKLRLQINPKTQIFPLKNGIDFLGFHSYLTDSGKVVKKIRRDSKNNVRRRLRRLKRLKKQCVVSGKTVQQSYNSWMGHAKHGDTYHLRKLIEEEFSGTIWNEKGSA